MTAEAAEIARLRGLLERKNIEAASLSERIEYVEALLATRDAHVARTNELEAKLDNAAATLERVHDTHRRFVRQLLTRCREAERIAERAATSIEEKQNLLVLARWASIIEAWKTHRETYPEPLNEVPPDEPA